MSTKSQVVLPEEWQVKTIRCCKLVPSASLVAMQKKHLSTTGNAQSTTVRGIAVDAPFVTVFSRTATGALGPAL